ncbi:MAG: peptidyl-prolyl cis-trans isomerase [Candidatus Aminicenantes bacterium]|nr:peptidyl-prolyl cis-trans isomerase [Candidatus Aminicenantes bacterium]
MRFLLALLLLFSAALHSQDVIEEIVAIVNDDIITLSEYRAEYQANLQALRAQLQGEEFGRQLEQMRKGLLNQMITDVLLLQEASKMEGLNVDEQMKLYIDNLKKENNIESDEEFIRILRQQGSDYDEWRAVLKKNMMKEAVVVTNVHQSIVIDEAEVVSYHKLHPEEFTDPPEYKLKGILISSGAGSDEGLEAKKREISGKIAAGEDFGALASEYSVGPEKEANGDLGIFKKGELAKDLEGAVENLKEGEITPWIQMRNVWYLLKLEEKKEARLKEFEEARRDIEQRIFAEKAQEKFEEFMKELREKSYIKILNPNPLDF